MTTVIYKPNKKLDTPILLTWVVMFKNIIKSKDLIWQLFKRDFIMSYRKSFIGVGWLLLAPVFGIVSWIFMNQTGILSPGDVGIPYPAYVLLSTSIWGLFIGFYSASSRTLSAGTGFIGQVYYHHEALLVKQLLQDFAGFGIVFILNIIVLLAFGVVPDWKILLFPILILPLLFLGSAIGLVLSVANVVATDISNFSDKFFAFLLFLTPVIYAPSSDNELLQAVIQYNPLTYLVGGVRDLIIYGQIDYWPEFLSFSALAFVLFLIALRLFYVSEDKVIEKIL